MVILRIFIFEQVEFKDLQLLGLKSNCHVVSHCLRESKSGDYIRQIF